MNITIIGAGVFGAWCAWFLSERHRVTLIDAYGPANARASSADHSRVIRCGYGADEIYSRWAHASLDDWRALETRVGHQLLVPSGALFLGSPGNDYIRATAATFTSLGHPIELLDHQALRDRFPQIARTGLGNTLFEQGAGVIRARAAVQALVQSMIQQERVHYEQGCVAPIDEAGGNHAIRLTSGVELTGDVLVFACGPWLPSIFPQAVGQRIRATRQEVIHFGVPAGDSRFSLSALPVWIDFEAGFYGVPDFDGRGFKIGIDRHGPPIDPDSHHRVIVPQLVSETRQWLAHRFPEMAGAPLVDAHVCQYESTHTGDFLIDSHPTWKNIWIVGGGSGHGFKHGPAIGRHVTMLVEGKASVEPRFALRGKKTEAERAVY